MARAIAARRGTCADSSITTGRSYGCLLDAVKAAAASAGIPYQRYIRQTLEAAVQRPRKEG